MNAYAAWDGGRLVAQVQGRLDEGGGIAAGHDAATSPTGLPGVAAESGFRVMAYDVPSSMPWERGENAHFVAVRGDDADEISAYWEKLTDGATVRQPVGPAAWSPLYGMLEDRFGVIWVLDVASA